MTCHGLPNFSKDICLFNDNFNLVFKESRLTLDFEKSKCCLTKIKFLGHVDSDMKKSPDFDKPKKISKMCSLKNRKYLSKVISNLSSETSSSRKLLSEKKNDICRQK